MINSNLGPISCRFRDIDAFSIWDGKMCISVRAE